MPVWIEILLMLLLILVAAEIFTNALEHLGEQLGISEGVTGSIFAAVGTAMPESIVPLVAVLAGGPNEQTNIEVGVGAILGAPLMLSTLSLSLMAFSVLGKRGAAGEMRPERVGLKRDVWFFMGAFSLASASLYLPSGASLLRVGAAVLLVGIYFMYVMLTLRASSALVADGHGTEAHSDLFLVKARLPDHIATAAVQALLGLALLIYGARGFVHGIEHASALLGVSPLLLSLLLVPVATELPEKVNSILWIRRGKDTLAFGNITGAMVFQGSLLPALGLAITPWRPNPEVLGGVITTLLAGAWLVMHAHRGRLQVWHVAASGLLYVGYLAIMLR
ncbi:MAG: sodium:calcium antiporter [Gammaproteobacteria bacterium]